MVMVPSLHQLQHRDLQRLRQRVRLKARLSVWRCQEWIEGLYFDLPGKE